MTWQADRAAPARRGAAGFTLLEMIVVLVVIGLVAGIVAGRGGQRSRALDTRATVAQIVRTLRQARGTAIASAVPVVVAFDGEHRTVSVAGALALQLPAPFVLTAASGFAPQPAAKPAAIRFDPNGSSNGGRVVLADGRREVKIGVDWLTGRVSVANAP